jgi:hypothetical protein
MYAHTAFKPLVQQPMGPLTELESLLAERQELCAAVQTSIDAAHAKTHRWERMNDTEKDTIVLNILQQCRALMQQNQLVKTMTTPV